MVKPTTIRVLFTLALAYGWSLRQVDINNAFLHGLLNEEVFMVQPPGMTAASSSQMVCRLKKAIYGLKQAPRAWFERRTIFLHSLGFVTSKVDSSLLVCHRNGHHCYVLVYVVDIIITGSSELAINHLVKSLGSV